MSEPTAAPEEQQESTERQTAARLEEALKAILFQLDALPEQLRESVARASTMTAGAQKVALRLQALTGKIESASALVSTWLAQETPRSAAIERLITVVGVRVEALAANLSELSGGMGRQYQETAVALKEATTTLSAAAAAVTSVANDLPVRLTTLSGQVSALPGQVVTPLQNQIASIATQVAPLHSQITNVSTQVGALPGQLTALSAQIREHLKDLPAQVAPIREQLHTLTDLTTELKDLPAQVGPLPGQINDLTNQISALPGQVVTPLQAQIGGIATQVAPLQSQITNIATQVAPLQGQIASVSTQIAPLQGQIANAISSQLGVFSKNLPAQMAELSDQVEKILSIKIGNSSKDVQTQIDELKNDLNVSVDFRKLTLAARGRERAVIILFVIILLIMSIFYQKTKSSLESEITLENKELKKQLSEKDIANNVCNQEKEKLDLNLKTQASLKQALDEQFQKIKVCRSSTRSTSSCPRPCAPHVSCDCCSSGDKSQCVQGPGASAGTSSK